MLRRFSTRRATASIDPSARWQVCSTHLLLLRRIEETALSTVTAGYPPLLTKHAIVRCLRGHDVVLRDLAPGVRRALPRLLDAIREAATAQLDAELIAVVCSDAMEVGIMLREAYCDGVRDGARTMPTQHAPSSARAH